MAKMILDAFLDGFTGGSLFTRARRPGAPTQLFADADTDCQQAGLVAALLALQRRENDAKLQNEAVPEEAIDLIVDANDTDKLAEVLKAHPDGGIRIEVRRRA
jgi:hypothetical protein